MPETKLPPSFVEILDRHGSVYAIVSPPRCSSTAFARVFWEQPSVGFYCHEPFEVTYYLQQDLDQVVERLSSPLDLDGLKFARLQGAIFPQVFERFRLPFAPEMLDWRACPEVELDNLGGRHRHLYGEVLESVGIKSDTTEIPALDSLPAAGGWRSHVESCLAIYQEMADSDHRILPAAKAVAP